MFIDLPHGEILNATTTDSNVLLGVYLTSEEVLALLGEQRSFPVCIVWRRSMFSYRHERSPLAVTVA
jgi:hypothetical protein